MSLTAGGPGSARTLKPPRGWPRTDPAICWSYHGGRWWRVNAGPDLAAMVADAAARTAATEVGTRRLDPMPGARFVATARDADPQTEWDLTAGVARGDGNES